MHRLYADISSEIDCKTCGNCCKEVSPVFVPEDIERFSTGINMSVDDFKNKYLIEDENEEGFTFNKKPCPFLNNNLCAQYECRPGDCRSFPHLHKKGIVCRLMNVVENTAICPIVFNVYEALKEEFWNNPEFDDFDNDDLDW